MSLRKLPEIKAFDALPDIEWRLPEEAVANWNESVRAANEGDDNIVSIYGVIGSDPFQDVENTDKRIAAALRRIGSRPITVNVNSPGGSFSHGLGIYNLLASHPAEVTIQIMGMAGSAASVIAMAGDEVRIPRAGFIMVHNASAVVLGNKYDVEEAGEMLAEIDGAMADVYAARAGVSDAKAAEWMDKNRGGGTIFRGQKAIDVGLADALLDEDKMEADASADRKQSRKAVAIIEQALMATGIPRAERRSLIGEAQGRHAVAGADRSAVASDKLAGLGLLYEAIPH